MRSAKRRRSGLWPARVPRPSMEAGAALKAASRAVLMAVFMVVFMASCGGKDNAAADGRPVIAVSFDSQRWIVRQIAGDDFDVVTLLPPGSDPEMFEPDMRAMRALEHAQVYLTTATLGFENRLADRISDNYPDLEVEDISGGIDIMMHTHALAGESDAGHDHGDDHGHESQETCGGAENENAGSHQVGDPHILSSLRNARIVARNVLSVVNRLNPGEGLRYSRNFEQLDERLAKADRRIDSLTGASPKKSFIVMHPSLSYFARDYGLLQIPLETDGKEVTPRQLEARMAKAADVNPAALFYERGHNARQADMIARRLGVEACPIVLNDSTFLREIELVGSRFATRPGNDGEKRAGKEN